MTQKNIQLTVAEENPSKLPEELQRLSNEAVNILWQNSHAIAKQEIEKNKQRYQLFEVEVLKQRQDALDKVVEVKAMLDASKTHIDALARENKSREVDLNRQTGELKSAVDQIHHLQERNLAQEIEIKRLIEEIGRLRESVDTLTKRSYEATRQVEQDRIALKAAGEEIVSSVKIRDRLDNNLKAAIQESEQVWKQLKQEQTRAAVADALTQELRETVKKLEGDIKLLKQEKHEMHEAMEVETKVRIDLEKKTAMLATRAESQEWSYKETISRLEKELESTKSETASLRNRLIKAEGALEREKKAIERLETKLIAAAGVKS
jgi:chromosome segregation ATPase